MHIKRYESAKISHQDPPKHQHQYLVVVSLDLAKMMMTITSSSSCFGFFFCPLQFISQFLSMLDKLIFNERQNIPLTCMRHIYYSFKTRQSIRQLKIQTTSKIFKQKQTCYAIARRRNQEKVFIEKKQCRMSIRDMFKGRFKKSCFEIF